MSEREQTNAEMMAAAVGLALAGRDIIRRTDRMSCRYMAETLDALGEGLAVTGGSLMHLADRLGLAADVERLVKKGQARVATARAFEGQGGRA